MSSPSRSPLSDTVDLLVAAAVSVVVIIAIVVVVVTGHSDSATLAVIVGPAVSGVTAIVLARRQSAAAAKVDQVAEQTNGKLTSALNILQDKAIENNQILRQQGVGPQ